LKQIWQAFASRGFVSDSWAFLLVSIISYRKSDSLVSVSVSDFFAVSIKFSKIEFSYSVVLIFSLHYSYQFSYSFSYTNSTAWTHIMPLCYATF